MRKALFLDRDGVLDELVYYADSNEWESPRRVEDIRLIPGAFEAVKRARAAGFEIVVITNQPSFAKGKISRESLEAVHAQIAGSLKSYVCYHGPADGCDCRKPGTKFVDDAARELDLDLAQSWFIGDQDSDLACGRAAGMRVILIEHAHSAHKRGRIEPDFRALDLAAAIEHVIQNAP